MDTIIFSWYKRYMKTKCPILPLRRIIYLICIIIFLLVTKNIYAERAGQEGKFVPPEGKVLFIVGQDKNTIDTYIDEIGIVPAGFMVYTSIQKMKGIYEPVDYGAGAQHAQYFADKYPNTVIQVGLYMVDALDDVLGGIHDDNIKKLGTWIKDAERPIYLRIGYEFDGPHNHYEPEKYIKAFRYIVDRLRKDNVENAAYVWHSYANRSEHPITDWYPGDEYVDWFAISYFNSRTKAMDSMAQLAKEHKKPLMIGESTPCGIGTFYAKHALERWYEPFFEFITEKDVKAVSYINSNWEALPMWKNQGWKDARVEANEVIKQRWLEEIQKEKYLHSSDKLYKILGYPRDE